jgi:hypothetical protein
MLAAPILAQADAVYNLSILYISMCERLRRVVTIAQFTHEKGRMNRSSVSINVNEDTTLSEKCSTFHDLCYFFCLACILPVICKVILKLPRIKRRKPPKLNKIYV